MPAKASYQAGAALLAAAILLLAAPANAGVSRVDKLRQTEQRLVRLIEKEKTTLRFFERHARLLYAKDAKVKRRAWHAVALARQRIIRSRVALERTRAALRRLRPPAIPHLPQWTCIHGYEGDWQDGGNPYWGGLQMDAAFMEAHGADMLARYGYPRGHVGANGWSNPWTSAEQMTVAERAYRGTRTSIKNGRVVFWQDSPRGYAPWPNTARFCGLL